MKPEDLSEVSSYRPKLPSINEDLEKMLKLKQDDWIEACGEIEQLEKKCADYEEALESIANAFIPDQDKEKYWLNRDHGICAQTLAGDTHIAREVLAKHSGGKDE